jgi:hypothetical protein
MSVSLVLCCSTSLELGMNRKTRCAGPTRPRGHSHELLYLFRSLSSFFLYCDTSSLMSYFTNFNSEIWHKRYLNPYLNGPVAVPHARSISSYIGYRPPRWAAASLPPRSTSHDSSMRRAVACRTNRDTFSCTLGTSCAQERESSIRSCSHPPNVERDLGRALLQKRLEW